MLHLLTTAIGTDQQSFRLNLMPALGGAADIAAEGWTALDRPL